MVTRNDSLWKSLDWVTICIYLLLIVGGWFSVCGASYDYGDRDFLDFSTRAGKQFVWIICSFGLGFVLLMLEDRMYDMFAYIIYIGMIILLIVTIFIAPDTKGSRSWLVMGPVSLQPAEFAKFATALALAKYINSYSFSIKKEKCALVLGFIILLPMLLIIGQRETGSALVYLAFFLVLYREGMPGVVLFSGVCAVIYFVVGIRFDEVFIADTPTPLGEFIVLLLILLFAGGMVWVYRKRWEPARNIIGGSLIVLLIAYLISEYWIHFIYIQAFWRFLRCFSYVISHCFLIPPLTGYKYDMLILDTILPKNIVRKTLLGQLHKVEACLIYLLAVMAIITRKKLILIFTKYTYLIWIKYG